jgi:hypothetical protein
MLFDRGDDNDDDDGGLSFRMIVVGGLFFFLTWSLFSLSCTAWRFLSKTMAF